MKAIVIHQYGNPEVLKFEDYPDPIPADNQILIRVAAAAVNPYDLKRRSGEVKDVSPIKFPGVIGTDVSGEIAKIGPGVKNFSVGDKIFAFADQTYAQLCAIPTANVAKVPAGLDVIDAAALPVVTTTGYQLVTLGAAIKPGQTILVTGATGSVGRSAVFKAKSLGAKVIAGILKKHLPQSTTLNADQIVTFDDESSMRNLPPLNAIADTVGGQTAASLLSKISPGGVFASVVGPPANAKDFPTVRIALVYAKPDPQAMSEMAAAVVSKKLVIPIAQKFPLSDAAQAHAAMQKGSAGKILLLP